MSSGRISPLATAFVEARMLRHQRWRQSIHNPPCPTLVLPPAKTQTGSRSKVFPELFLQMLINYQLHRCRRRVGAWHAKGWVIAEFLGLSWGRVPSRMSLMVHDHGRGREALGRLSLRVSFGMFLVVSDRGCGWKVSWRMLLGRLLGMSMAVLDCGMGWEVSRRVLVS